MLDVELFVSVRHSSPDGILGPSVSKQQSHPLSSPEGGNVEVSKGEHFLAKSK